MKHPALGSIALVFALLPAACADTGTAANNGGTTAAGAAGDQHATRHRPRHASVTRALDEAATRSQTCLPPSVHGVNVTGAFVGATGEYHVDAVHSDQPLSSELRECVREQFENARVEPFTNERFDAAQAVSRESAATPGASVATTATTANPATSADATQPLPTPPVALPTPPVATPLPPPTPVTADVTPPTPGPTPGPLVIPHPARTHEPPAAAQAGPISVGSIVGCYRTAVRSVPTLGGRARMRFSISSDGAVQNVQIAQPPTAGVMRSPLLTQVFHCIESRVRAQALPHAAPGAYDLALTFAPVAGGTIAITQRNAGLLAAAPQDATGNGGDASNGGGGSTPDAAGGPLDLAQIANVVRRRTADVRSCYTNALARDGQLRMQLRVRFEIEQGGTVATASSRSVVTAGEPDGADEVARCVEGVVRSTTFPARSTGGSMEAVLPFNFTPTGSAPASAPVNTGAAPAGPLATTGRIDPTRVSMVIRSRTPILRECYTRALGGDPALAGRVMVHFVVDPAGRVLEVTSQTTVRSGNPEHFAEVARCIEGVMQVMTLPPPAGGAAAVALPFDFGPTSM